MIRISLVVSFLLFSCFLFAQGLGDKYATFYSNICVKKEARISEALASSDYGVYLHKKAAEAEYLVLVNYEGKVVAETLLDLKVPGLEKKKRIYEAFVFGNKLYVIFEYIEGKLKQKTTIIECYNGATLDFEKTIITNTEAYTTAIALSPMSGGDNDHVGEAAEIGVAIENGSSKFAFYTSPCPNTAQAPEEIAVRVFDKSGNLLWENSMTFPDLQTALDLGQMYVMNNGDVYVHCSSAIDPFQEKIVINHKVVHFSNNGQQVEEIAMPEEFSALRGVAMNVSEDGRIEFYGYVNGGGEALQRKDALMGQSDKFKNTSIAGYEVFVFDPASNSIVERKRGLFSDDFLKEMMSDSEEKKMDKAKEKGEDEKVGLNNLRATEYIKTESGDCYIIGEEYTQAYLTTQNGTRTFHLHGDIVISKMNESGEMLWTENIPRMQRTSDYRVVGHVLDFNGKDMTFYFNDHIDNCTGEPNKKLKDYNAQGSNNQIHMFNITSDGVISEYSMPKDETGYSELRPARAIHLPNGGLFFIESNNEYHIGRFIKQLK